MLFDLDVGEFLFSLDPWRSFHLLLEFFARGRPCRDLPGLPAFPVASFLRRGLSFRPSLPELDG
jgi:hypothetical protein